MKQAGDSVLPALQVSIQGNPAWLLFDTGNSGGVVLKRSFALNKGIYDEATDSQQGIASGINEVAAYERFRIDSVTVGPYELENVMAAIPAEGESVRIGLDANSRTGTRLRRGVKTEGLIGFDVLKHFLVTIDYDRHRVHLYAP